MPMTLQAALRSAMLDITPLRTSPAFLRLWIGSGISTLGGTMTPFAVMLQVYRATHSTLDVGLTGLASVLPGALFVLLGGSVGDRAPFSAPCWQTSASPCSACPTRFCRRS